jgi:predicted RNA-binding Zn-ribbon protein involved in translation (DUF1610 family)
MFCPNCGKQNVKPGDPSPNGGELYVAEEMEGCNDFFDEAHPHECSDCGTQFYMGAK